MAPIRWRHTAVALVLGAIAAPPLLPMRSAAQAAPSPAPAGTFLHRSDAIFLGGALATAAVTSLFDLRIANAFTSPSNYHKSLHDFANAENALGGYGPIAISATLFAGGHLIHRAEWIDIGTWGLEAVAVSGIATTLLKGVAGRTRPYAAAGDPDNYKFVRGFTHEDFSSFPSGHSSGAFAFASVLDRATAASASRRTHVIIATSAYTLATGVGLARMYTNKHWASDVIVGAALGMTSGVAVVRHGLAKRANAVLPGRADFLLHPSLASAPGGGLTVTFSSR